MFRWGIISTAGIGQGAVIPAILDSDNGVVQAIASRNAEKARAVADRFGVPLSFGSYEELLASDQIDGVYIPLPTSQHIEWAIKAAEAGKHVLCEKPISLNASEIDAVIAARDKHGVTISEAFMVTYHPQWLKTRDLIADGAIGSVRMVQGAFTYHNMDGDNMRNIVELGGGALPDIGVYPTVGTRFATGAEARRVSATVRRDPNFGTDVFSSIRADFGEFELSFYVSTQMALRQHMVFHGEKGRIEVTAPFNADKFGAPKITLHNQGNSEIQEFRFIGPNQYRLQSESFVRHVQGKGDPIFTLEDSINNQKLIDGIYKAGESGNWEDV